MSFEFMLPQITIVNLMQSVGRSCEHYLGFSVGAGGQQVLPLGLFGQQPEAMKHCCFAETACQSRTTLERRSKIKVALS